MTQLRKNAEIAGREFLLVGYTMVSSGPGKAEVDEAICLAETGIRLLKEISQEMESHSES